MDKRAMKWINALDSCGSVALKNVLFFMMTVCKVFVKNYKRTQLKKFSGEIQ